MKTNRVIKIAGGLAAPYRITDGQKFRLKDVEPSDTGALKAEDKPRAKEARTHHRLVENAVEIVVGFSKTLIRLRETRRHGEIECLRSPKIDTRDILSGLLDWNFLRTLTPNDFIHQSSALTA